MSAHRCTESDAGCWRCDLSRTEADDTRDALLRTLQQGIADALNIDPAHVLHGPIQVDRMGTGMLVTWTSSTTPTPDQRARIIELLDTERTTT